MTVTLECVKDNEASRATTDLHVIESPVDRNEIALRFHNQTSDLLKAKEWTERTDIVYGMPLSVTSILRGVSEFLTQKTTKFTIFATDITLYELVSNMSISRRIFPRTQSRSLLEWQQT